MFWYGLESLREGARGALGHLQDRLWRQTARPLTGFLAGALCAALLNSSGATALLTVGLVEAQLVGLRGAIAMILGANVGTTVVPQILASPLGDWGLPLAGVGALMKLGSPWRRVRAAGQGLMGFGLVLLGLGTAASSLQPVARGVDWAGLLAGLRGPVRGLGLGVVMALALQSGNAAVAILQGVAGESRLPVLLAAPVVMGINLGSSLPTLLAALVSGGAAGRRVAVFHVLCNAVGIAVFFPASAALARLAVVSAVYPPSQVALVHTLFNLGTSLAELPFVAAWEKLCRWLVPGKGDR
ncbi:MAG: Na/Pi symporter [Bacillota bacterium]|nr:Na/Pi symporter [Bacillota bacterium]